MKIVCSALMSILAGVLLTIMPACEVEVGDSEEANDSRSDNAASTANTVVPADKTQTGDTNPQTGGGDSEPDPVDPTDPAPGIPSLLSPGNGEKYTGGGAKVTFSWTDAEHAEQFELIVQALGSGGWQQAARQVTDNFQFSYTLSNTAWTQYRWAVRSIGADGQTSAYTGYRSFTWTP